MRHPRAFGAQVHMPAVADGVQPVGQGLALMTHELQVVRNSDASMHIVAHIACTVQTRAWQAGGGPTGPVGPVAPCAPLSPLAPAGPATPCGPVGPRAPAGPVGPSGPAGPIGPVGPTGPVRAMSQVAA